MKRLRSILSIIVFALILVFPGQGLMAQETEEAKEKRMQWFEDARLGIFIHWGIYSVYGIDESWSFFNKYLPYESYMQQLDGFTAENYDPHEWAGLFRRSGARYAVMTAKHHDGVSLWDTSCNDLSVVRKTPAGKDLVGPFVDALRKNGMKVGLYFSLLDWSHPDYPNFTRTEKRYTSDPERWNRFIDFNFCQLEELSEKYNPDLFWFDGDWEAPAEAWRARELTEKLREMNRNVILNNRIQGYGDYATPEQGLPVTRPRERYWELCMTMNDSWGYQHNDHRYKTPNQVINIFVETISKGGNLLLDVGPMPDGSIPDEQVEILEELGRWTSKHKEAIYGTRAGIPAGHFHGPTTLGSEGDILYLYLPYKPIGPVALKGIINKVNRIWVVGNGTKLSYDVLMKQYWSSVPGIIYIDIPEVVLDKDVTVLAVLLDGKIELYREGGQVIESN